MARLAVLGAAAASLLGLATTRVAGAQSPQPAFYTWQAPGGASTAGQRVIALTFDDGPGPYTPQVLSVLEQYHVPATFFEIGENIAQYPQYTQMVAAAGYPVENHTWSHPDLATLSAGQIDSQIEETQNEIRSLTGETPTCLRPPYDDWNSTVLGQIASQGLTAMSYSVDPRDWSMPGVAAIVSGVVDAAFPGAVVDMHDGGGNRSETAAALPAIISELESRGYSFVSICGDMGGAPSVVLQPDGTPSIFARGTGGSLWNYWSASGLWDAGEVVPSGVASAPVAVLQPDGSPSVFFEGSGGSLWNYWYSSGVWYSHEIVAGGVTSAPAVVLQENSAPSVFVQSTGNGLLNYWYIPSLGIWGSATVAGAGSADSSPAVVTQGNAGGAPSVFVEGPHNSLLNYWYIPAQGIYGAATVAAFGSAYSAPAVALQADGAPTLFVEGPDNSLLNYWYIPAQGIFGAATVAGAGKVFGAPAVTSQADGAPSIVFEGPADTFWNYWYVSGTWDSSQVASGVG